MKKTSKLKTTLTSVIQGTILSVLILTLSLIGPQLQHHYLRSHVGSQVLYIQNPDGAAIRGSATGFAVKAPSGKVYTLTNAHVCALQKDGFVMVGTHPNNPLTPRRVIQVYTYNDLCLVEGMAGYEGLSLADSYDIGDINHVIGHPLGQAQDFTTGVLKDKVAILLPEEEVSLDKCNGPYQSVERVQSWLGEMDMCMVKRYAIATNIVIYGGNSGSPMVNSFGNVTGVMFAGNNRTAWGYAVPLEDVIRFLKAY